MKTTDIKNKYQKLANEIEKKLKIHDKNLIKILKISIKNVTYNKIQINNDYEIKKYITIFFAILKIYTDFILLLEDKKANDEN